MVSLLRLSSSIGYILLSFHSPRLKDIYHESSIYLSRVYKVETSKPLVYIVLYLLCVPFPVFHPRAFISSVTFHIRIPAIQRSPLAYGFLALYILLPLAVLFYQAPSILVSFPVSCIQFSTSNVCLSLFIPLPLVSLLCLCSLTSPRVHLSQSID